MAPLSGAQRVPAAAERVAGGDSAGPGFRAVTGAQRLGRMAGSETDLLRRYAETGDPGAQGGAGPSLPAARPLPGPALPREPAARGPDPGGHPWAGQSIGRVRPGARKVLRRVRGTTTLGEASPPLPRLCLGGAPARAPGADDGGQRGGGRAQRRAPGDSTVSHTATRLNLDDEEIRSPQARGPSYAVVDVPRSRQDLESVPMVETVGQSVPGLRRSRGSTRCRGGLAG